MTGPTMSPSVTMDHATVKTVHCSGSPYEIGFTHGKCASDEVHNNIATYTFFFAETAKLTWPEARLRAATQFVPTLQEKYPEILEEMKGIAAGAGSGLVMEDILALNVRSEIALTNYSDGCTAIAQSAAPGKAFLAQNWDWLAELHTGMVFLDIKPAGEDVNIKFLSEAGLVGKYGMNSYGVGLVTNALRSGSINTSNFPVHVMHRKIMQNARTYEEAVEIINKYGLACTVNYIIGDKHGSFGNIECSPLGNTITLPETDGFVVHTNHLCGVNRPAKLRDHPAPNSFSRLERIRELTEKDKANGVVTSSESIRARLSDQQGLPYSICRDRPPGAVGMEKMTTLSTIIMDLASSTARITIGRPCDDLPVIEWSF